MSTTTPNRWNHLSFYPLFLESAREALAVGPRTRGFWRLTRLIDGRYTLHMKRVRILSVCFPLLILLSLLTLGACGPGSLGNEGIAFIRAGNLWTIDPNGTNAFEAVAQSTPVIGYGLSPAHQIFVFRSLDSDFARTTAGKHLVFDALTGLTGDVPSGLSAIGIDGGTPIPLILPTPQLPRSDAWWTPDGSRLLYREGASPSLLAPDLAVWWISQSDQPSGIARKEFPATYSMPVVNNSKMTIGDSRLGLFTTTLAGTNDTLVVSGDLVGHPLPASLERVLWQPRQPEPAILYAVLARAQNLLQINVQLILHTAQGQSRILTTCTCRQFAWSPDGQHILYSTDQGYSILNIQKDTLFAFQAEHGAVPYWSPDGQSLLLDGLHTLTLIRLSSQRIQVLLSDGQTPVTTDTTLPGSGAFSQPLANSLWNSDSQRFVLLTRGRTLWQGKALSTGNGIYTVALNKQGDPQGAPAAVDSNSSDRQPGWSYEDPDTSFLF